MIVLAMFIATCAGIIVLLVLWDRKERRRAENLSRQYWDTLKDIRNRNHNQSLPPGKGNPTDGGRKEKK